MAAVSPLNLKTCFQCHAPLGEVLLQHACSSCGFPQPLSKGEDYFETFHVPRKFQQDLKEVEQRFYRISRALHPDRFVGAGKEIQTYSLQRMTLLNDAFTTLKSPAALRQYLIRLEGVEAPGKASIPLELAEAWFEIQEGCSARRIQEFLGELALVKAAIQDSIAKLEREYDQTSDRNVLAKIAAQVQKENYLKSIEKDVAQKKTD